MVNSSKNKTNNHKLIFLFINCIILIFFLIGGVIVKLPLLLLISVYAFLITNYTLFNNKKILNSLSIPFTFTYLFVMIYDFSQINILFGLFHLVTVILSFIIFFRLNVSLIIMFLASFFYALWIFLIMVFLDFPYYQCIFGICDNLYQFFIVLLIGLITSMLGSNNLIKRTFVTYMTDKIKFISNKKE